MLDIDRTGDIKSRWQPVLGFCWSFVALFLPLFLALPAMSMDASAMDDGKPAKELVTWYTDLVEGSQKAAADKKLVLVDVYTDWCGWCKRLDRDTYSNPKVAQFLNDQFVSVKIDAEDNGPGQAMAKKYAIRGYPCILVLDPSGKLLGAFYGYKNAEEFPKAISKMLAETPDNVGNQPAQ